LVSAFGAFGDGQLDSAKRSNVHGLVDGVQALYLGPHLA